jgi:hypothetical protein
MNRLPFELTDKIFDLLSATDISTLSLLNQHWHKIASSKLYRYPLIKNEKKLALFVKVSEKSQSYIQVLDLTSVHQYITDKQLSPLTKHVKNLKQLNLSKCIDLSPNIILSIIQINVYSLNALSLGNCTLTKDILHYIGKANQNRLKLLDLSNTMIKPCISIDSPNHLETMLLSPFSLSQLTHLDLSYCAWVDSQTVENISCGLPQLRDIVLQWCNQVKSKSIHTMVKRLTHLNSIDIRHIDAVTSIEHAFGIMDHAVSLKKISFTSSCKRTTAQIGEL